MIIVPMIAMFSHKVPTAMRTACGELLVAPINYFCEVIFRPPVASSAGQEMSAFDTAPNVPLLANRDSRLDISDDPNTSTESATLEKLLQQVHHWQQQVSVRVTANSTETLSY